MTWIRSRLPERSVQRASGRAAFLIVSRPGEWGASRFFGGAVSGAAVGPLAVLGMLAAITVACGGPQVRPAPFRERPDSVHPGDMRGPYDGRVLDSETGRPIAGALVYASWSFIQGEGLNGPGGVREYLASTDANGRYEIPRLNDLPHGVRLADFRLVVYKKGYVAYRSDHRYRDFGPRTDFAQRHHEVRLEKWRPDLSHVRHLRYVGGGAALAALTAWELPEAAAELSRQPGKGTLAGERDGGRGNGGGTDAGDTASPRRILDADELLLVDDVKRATGYAGTFDVGKLGDDPTSAEYDNVHLRARGRPETYDIALRVWMLDEGEAQRQFGRLLEELPNAQPRDEIGDRSLRAASDAKDIFGLAWLDGKRGIVALLTCGAALCRSHEVVLGLARMVHERIDAKMGAPE